MRTIFFSHEGPMIQTSGGGILISDLNPENEMRWRLSRLEMLKIGFRFIGEALWGQRDE